MKLGSATQQPNERLSYSFNYSRALVDGDTILQVTPSVAPAGLTIDEVGVFNTVVQFWVSGGVSGRTYKVTLLVETAAGRRFEDEIDMLIQEI